MGTTTARKGDRTHGTCSAHTTPITVGGTITKGSPDVRVNGMPAARVGDEVTADCGHKSQIISGNTTVLINGKPSARVGDSVGSGPYVATIISGSPDTDS